MVSDMDFVDFSRNESSSSESDDSVGDTALSQDNERDASKVDFHFLRIPAPGGPDQVTCYTNI